jgi:hypothetical protein
VILDTDEQGKIHEPEEYNYRLLAYTPRESIVPAFSESDPPETHQEMSAGLSQDSHVLGSYRLFQSKLSVKGGDIDPFVFLSNI